MTTDAQAALAAAARVMSSWLSTGAGRLAGISPEIASQYTTTMAGQFLRELQRAQGAHGGRPIVVRSDERLVPNEDFRSASAAETERVDSSAVLAAAETRRVEQIMASGDVGGLHGLKRRLDYSGPHALDQINRTPSGKYACLCGESWPCSQRERS